MIYRFIVDHQLTQEIEKALKKNNFSHVKQKKSEIYFSIKLSTEDENEALKLHYLLVDLHQIKDNGFVKADSKKNFAIYLNQLISTKGPYTDYILTAYFLNILKENNIEFSLAKFKTSALSNLDTLPIWINQKDLKKISSLINGGPIGHPHILIDNFYVITD